jgi:hypothetical protein
MIKNGSHFLVRRRESYEDLLSTSVLWQL